MCCCMGSTISRGNGMMVVSKSAVSLWWGTAAPRMRRNRENKAVAFIGNFNPPEVRWLTWLVDVRIGLSVTRPLRGEVKRPTCCI